MTQIFCGIDWAEHHHDVALVDDRGNVVARRRITDDTDGFRTLLDVLAEHGDTPEHLIPVAIETSRGLLVACLRATGERSTRSTRWPPPAIGSGARSPARNRIMPTR